MRRAWLFSLLVASSASAQPTQDKALADQLFQEGRDLAKAEKWAAACPKFEASLRYDAVLGTKLNLATCYEKTGKLAAAWGLFREITELAQRAGDAKRADYAAKQVAAIQPRLAKLTITVTSPVPGLVVKRDGIALEAATYGSALYVDPGAHEVVASAPGVLTWSKEVTLQEGKAETLEVPLVPAPVVEVKPVEPSVVQPATAPDASPSRARAYAGLGIAAVGLASVGVGLVFGNKASGTYDDAKALCGDDLACADADYDRGSALVSDARSQATLSTVFVIAGGVALVGGTVLWLTAPSARRSETATSFAPIVGRDQIGLSATGAF